MARQGNACMKSAGNTGGPHHHVSGAQPDILESTPALSDCQVVGVLDKVANDAPIYKLLYMNSNQRICLYQ